MDEQTGTRPNRMTTWSTVLVALAAIVAAVLAGRWYRRRKDERAAARAARASAPPIHLPDVKGLTEEEARARRTEGQDNLIHFTPPRTRNQIIRDNVYTIFNLTLVGLAVAQLLLRLPLEALISLGVILLNIALNVIQEMFARRRLQVVELSTRPKATVVRDQRARSIDPSEIVQGDILIVGPGDQILVDGQVAGDGQIVVDESMLTGDTSQYTRRAGDTIFAGSFCISGRAAYEAQKVGNERLVASLTDESEIRREELTDLEQIMNRVLRILMVIVFGLTVVLLVNFFALDVGVDTEPFAGAASVIFSIAPSSLFFMVFLTYAAGTADLAKVGALVHRSRSVESLAQVTSICFARAGILTGTHIEMETFEPPEGHVTLSESRIQQILGDFARTASADNVITRVMADIFEGSQRAAVEEAPFFSVYGWSGIALDDDDLRGVYVLGEPEILEQNLISTADARLKEEDDGPSALAALQTRIAGVGRFFRRPAETKENEKPQMQDPELGETESLATSHDTPGADLGKPPETNSGRFGFAKRLRGRVGRLLQRDKSQEQEVISNETTIQESVFTFAYVPGLGPLHAPTGSPLLPEGLIPLCDLRYSEQVRPEAVETIKGFAEAGVGIKVFAGSDPERAAFILRQAGLGADIQKSEGTPASSPLRTVSGAELAEMDPNEFRKAASHSTIFSHLSREQASQIVRALQEQGESVAVVGDSVNDLSPMRQANLSIARHNSSQSALSAADIILLESSSSVLLGVLDKGQRIVNGLLDVLKLYLTQVFYLAMLIIAIWISAHGFPYQTEHGTAIGVITLSIPSLALSLLAMAGIVRGDRLRGQLTRFVAPAAVTITLAGLAVFGYFLSAHQDMAYAQLTLTYTLVLAGLVLVVFIRPPKHLKPGRDWLFAVIAVILMAIFLVLPAIRLAQKYLGLYWLQQPGDYLIVGIALLCWGVVLQLTWLILRLLRQQRALRSA